MVDDDWAAWRRRMRADWDERASRDAERAIYTRDHPGDEPDFDRSGEANFNQLVRPYIPVLLGGRPARLCRAAEIGCGIGRMTKWLASAFREVDAFDVSPNMIAGARERLADCANVCWHVSSGSDLEPLSAASIDFVFSYIVFQHIPAREIVARYIAEAARVLKPGGVVKFQVNGSCPAADENHVPDTWRGVSFTGDEIADLLHRNHLARWSTEGAGTQYFVITARRGPIPDDEACRTYVFPGEPWAEAQLGDGWGAPVETSWRPLYPVATARLARPTREGARFFFGLYAWPGESSARRTLAVEAGAASVEIALEGAGDHYLEIPFEPEPGGSGPVLFTFRHNCDRAPAVRCFGLYVPAASPGLSFQPFGPTIR